MEVSCASVSAVPLFKVMCRNGSVVSNVCRGQLWSRISVKILFYIFHRLFSFMIFLQGLFSWSFNSHGPAFSHGLFARSFLMVFSHDLSHGLFSWSFFIVFIMEQDQCQYDCIGGLIIIVFSHRLFLWSLYMVFLHCLFFSSFFLLGM